MIPSRRNTVVNLEHCSSDTQNKKYGGESQESLQWLSGQESRRWISDQEIWRWISRMTAVTLRTRNIATTLIARFMVVTSWTVLTALLFVCTQMTSFRIGSQQEHAPSNYVSSHPCLRRFYLNESRFVGIQQVMTSCTYERFCQNCVTRRGKSLIISR